MLIKVYEELYFVNSAKVGSNKGVLGDIAKLIPWKSFGVAR